MASFANIIDLDLVLKVKYFTCQYLENGESQRKSAKHDICRYPFSFKAGGQIELFPTCRQVNEQLGLWARSCNRVTQAVERCVIRRCVTVIQQPQDVVLTYFAYRRQRLVLVLRYMR